MCDCCCRVDERFFNSIIKRFKKKFKTTKQLEFLKSPFSEEIDLFRANLTRRSLNLKKKDFNDQFPMEGDNGIEASLTAEEVEFAQTTARYGEVLSKCKLLRSRLMMTAGNIPGNSGSQELDNSETAVIDSLDKLEEQFHRVCIQEEMLKNIKVTKLALDLFSSEEHTYEGLDDLIKEHCANQAKLYELAQSLRKERLIQKKAIGQLLEQLCHYTAALKDDQVKLESTTSSDSTSTLELKKHMEKQIKEIRFMQICISKLVSHVDIDLRKSENVKEILKSVRNPITSIDNFI